MEFDLAFIWAGIIAFAVLAYVIMDGFDLGIGMLFPLLHDEGERDVAMNSVAPVWAGKETWLVLGGGGLMAAFPLAYATVLPALYAPITAMLIGLILRGVAFEFRWRANDKTLWDISFVAGSTIATLAQGIALGALVQGIEIAGRAYAGGWWDWLTPFTILCGVSLAIGYMLLGACWLVLKTEGELQARARRFAQRAGAGTLLLIGLVSLWTPFLQPSYLDRWFSWPSMAFSAVVPVLLLGCVWALYTGLRGAGHDSRPFLAALGIFVLCYAGIGISFYPHMVPPNLTIWQAAAPDSSLGFLLVGALVLIPMIIAYTAYAYWVFRGKIDPKASYH
ncbi:MAG: cytochrome d ubiquinol oxidase subunit II [Alphaproteobacteria bacterium]